MNVYLLLLIATFVAICAACELANSAFERTEPTTCTNPLSHALDACARRNGGQL